MPMKDDEDEEEWAPAAHLSRDGKIEGLYLPRDQRREPESWVAPPPEPPLELAELPPKPPPPPPEPEPPRPSHWKGIAVGAGVLLACAAAVFFLVRRAGVVRGSAPVRLRVPANPEGWPTLTVQSDPPGAKVFVDGEESGGTPLLGTNEFAKGSEVQVRLELKGYAPWTGTFAGGENATVRAALKRK